MTDRTRQIEQLLECFQAIKRRLGSKHVIAPDDALRHITPSQWGVIRIVSHTENISTKDIAAQLGITSSAATQLVDALVENGYLKRKENPDDRRSQNITLSEQTKKRMRELRKNHLARLSDVFSALSNKELDQYLQLSSKVADTLLHS